MKKSNHKSGTLTRSLYFLAVVAPEPVQSQLTELKYLARDLFHSGHALNAPAHLTLIPPFFARQDQMDRYVENLYGVLKNHKAFSLRLKGFDKFGRRVIFVDVVPNPMLDKLQADLYDFHKFFFQGQVKPNGFHPHFTVAFRDLDEDIFPEAWNYFSNMDYEAVFDVNRIAILRHKDKRWHITDSLDLPKKIR